jgi:hypothetical protein
MKVSSITNNSLESRFIVDSNGKLLLDAVQNYAASLLQLIDRVGTSIALGEKGDLDAAHEFRMQALGKK